jgi:hypothetical protein
VKTVLRGAFLKNDSELPDAAFLRISRIKLRVFLGGAMLSDCVRQGWDERLGGMWTRRIDESRQGWRIRQKRSRKVGKQEPGKAGGGSAEDRVKCAGGDYCVCTISSVMR